MGKPSVHRQKRKVKNSDSGLLAGVWTLQVNEKMVVGDNVKRETGGGGVELPATATLSILQKLLG